MSSRRGSVVPPEVNAHVGESAGNQPHKNDFRMDSVIYEKKDASVSLHYNHLDYTTLDIKSTSNSILLTFYNRTMHNRQCYQGKRICTLLCGWTTRRRWKKSWIRWRWLVQLGENPMESCLQHSLPPSMYSLFLIFIAPPPASLTHPPSSTITIQEENSDASRGHLQARCRFK